MPKKKTDLSYEEASLEIRGILQKLEAGDTPIDQILQEVERASGLIQFCKSKLHQVSDSLNKALDPEAPSQMTEE